MELLLGGLTWRICLVYLDDVLIMGQMFDEHLKNLQKVFNRIREANLKLNPKRCFVWEKEVEFLGHVVFSEEVRTSDDKIEAVRNWAVLWDKHETRSSLGLYTYYRLFVQEFATIAAWLLLCINLRNVEHRFSGQQNVKLLSKDLKLLVLALFCRIPREGDWLLQ